MRDNPSAFSSCEYDRKIRQTLPYYETFYTQVTDLVKTVYETPVSWLDVGCGTGKMARTARESGIPIRRMVLSDISPEMRRTAEKENRESRAEFCIADVRDLPWENAFDVVTAIQVFHYLREEERREALGNVFRALKENGSFISFENIAPFTETGKEIYLEKWRRYQVEQGRSPEEAAGHIGRYGKGYFPITVEEHLRQMRNCGFRAVEILWFSNLQAGFWGVK